MIQISTCGWNACHLTIKPPHINYMNIPERVNQYATLRQGLSSHNSPLWLYNFVTQTLQATKTSCQVAQIIQAPHPRMEPSFSTAIKRSTSSLKWNRTLESREALGTKQSSLSLSREPGQLPLSILHTAISNAPADTAFTNILVCRALNERRMACSFKPLLR